MALNVISTNRLSTNVKSSNLAANLSGKVGSSKNLFVNGAMNVAQRKTSDTTDAQGYTTVDRWKIAWSGADAIIETHQEQLSSSDTGPWAAGFRNAYKLVNGNQSSGAGAADFVNVMHYIEAQDVATSGWEYNSTSSYVTLSFWVKSSVAQNFYGYLRTPDGTVQSYPFETGSLSANTWTKITKTIPGNANLTINNDTGGGLQIVIWPFAGTNYPATPTLNTWAAYSGSARTPANTSTWWTTDDASFHLTGMQLEVGETATSFEHTLFVDELAKCQRYYYRIKGLSSGDDFASGFNTSTTQCRPTIVFPVRMRTAISAVEQSGTAGDYSVAHAATETACSAVPTFSGGSEYNARVVFTVASGLTQGQGSASRAVNANAYLGFSADF